MAIQYRNFEVTRARKERFSIGGTLAVAAVQGMIVNRVAGATDTLELSTGQAGFFLRRDCVTSAAIKTQLEQDMIYPDKNGFETPYVIGGSAQAEDHDEIWVEGAALLHASMDVNTRVGDLVTSVAGKFSEVTNLATQEIIGKVVLNEAARNGGGGRRFLIQVIRNGKQTIAA